MTCFTAARHYFRTRLAASFFSSNDYRMACWLACYHRLLYRWYQSLYNDNLLVDLSMHPLQVQYHLGHPWANILLLCTPCNLLYPCSNLHGLARFSHQSLFLVYVVLTQHCLLHRTVVTLFLSIHWAR